MYPSEFVELKSNTKTEDKPKQNKKVVLRLEN